MLFKKNDNKKENDIEKEKEIEILDLDGDDTGLESIEEDVKSEESKAEEKAEESKAEPETESKSDAEKASEVTDEITEVPEEADKEANNEANIETDVEAKEDTQDEVSEEAKEESSEADTTSTENSETKEELKETAESESESEEVKTEDSSAEEQESQKKPKSKIVKFIGRFFAFLGVTLLMVIIGLYVVMWIVTKGPSSQIKELFVLSVRESSAGGFLADIYLTPEEIAAIEEKNSVQEINDVTDTSIVQIAVKTSESEGNSSLETEANGNIADSSFDVNVYTENGIEFHEIAGTTFTGIAMVVSDPSRVFIGTPRDTYDGGPGISVPSIADRYGAIAATNGGFFVDTGGHGDGGTPIGCVFSNGKMVYGSAGGFYNLMGFNEEGVLICGYMSGQSAIDLGIRDGLQCNPFLIINGEGVNVGGKGGGLNPRTALGQRADGAVVLLTIDGRQASSLGASMSDMVDVMLSFDVVNAGNLDGGGSTVLYYNGEIQNVVMSIYGARGVPNAVCVRPE
ncbi:MAG: phosphodiester glycosidase family protein [Lachnospiraceae bacterium]|nr:phosphodiester glycosidase family protein [Lachnospiraceae bacterium]